MGNRSKLVVGAAAAGVGLGAVRRARRRSQLREMADGIQSSILPTHVPVTAEREAGPDEAHAPGHQHLGPPEDTDMEVILDRPIPRPWSKRHHGLRHPGRLSS